MIVMKHYLILLASVFAVSCSVKEDRVGCPCFLRLDFSRCQTVMTDVNISCFEGGETVLKTKTFPKDYRRSPYVAKVPKGEVEVTAWWGTAASAVKDGVFEIPAGCQCDSLYAHFNVLDCMGEDARDTVSLFKQFATIRLIFVGYEKGGFPFGIVARGSVNGYDLRRSMPVDGEFIHKLKEGAQSVRVPRQNDGSLLLELMSGGSPVSTLPVGEWILDSGYSWKDENLDDIVLEIDMSGLEARLRVDNWEYGYEFSVEI